MLDFNYTLLIQFLNLIIVLVLLNMLLFKPVLRAINRREEMIASATDKAKTATVDKKRLETSYDETLKEKRRPITDMRDATVAEAHAAAMKTIEKARTELGEEMDRIKREVGAESQKLFESLRKDVDRLSAEAAGKILMRNVA